MSRWQDHFPWATALSRALWPEGRARRKRWLKIAVGVLLLLAAHALWTALAAASARRAAAPFVRRFGPFDVAMHVPAPVEDVANQARAVRAATEILALSNEEGRVLRDLAAGKVGEPSAADRETIRRTVQANVLAFALLDTAAGRGKTNWDLHYTWGASVDVPPLLRILQLGKLNAAAGVLAVEEGRVDEAIAAVRRGATLASSLRSEPILIVHVVRMGLIRIELDLVRRILATAALRPDQIAALESLLPHANPRLLIQQAYVVETKVLHGFLRGDEAAPSGVLRYGALRALLRPFLFREERLLLARMSRRIDDLDAPRHARKEGAGESDVRSWDVLVPIYDGRSEIDRTDLEESREALARAALALERHRLALGRPPASLAELAEAVPVDPLTGRAFQYETDGRAWRIRSTFDVRGMGEVATWFDPVLDWSRGRRSPPS